MISLPIVVGLLFAHLIGDFFLQSNWMALNKSKRLDALLLHAAVYSLCFIAFGFWFWLITLVTHAITDAITSRITSKLWFIDLVPKGPALVKGQYPYHARIVDNKRHWFFVVIGMDQYIHYLTLLLTYWVLCA